MNTLNRVFFTHLATLLLMFISASALADERLPAFDVPTIFGSNNNLTEKQIHGQVSLLNIWASWCSACASEHRLLMKIANQYHVRIYGVLYRDSASDALSYLKRQGNPYYQLGYDATGDALSNFNVYGTPETYIIAPNGNVVYHQTGAMTQSLWENVLYPIVKEYQ